MGRFVRGGKNGTGCFVRGDKNCMGCFVRGGKLMRDVLSGVAKNGMGCFVPGCFVLHSVKMYLCIKINYDKTTCMIVGTQQRTKNILPLNICIDGNKINDVKKQKLLGIYIDENLRWTDHIDHLCANISSKISLSRQLSTYIPTEAQKMFYQGYILPLIDYGSCTWGTTSKSNIERLSRLQKRAARIILNVPYDTASSDMFNALGWPTIEKRHSYNKAVLTYKALNNLTPLYISELLISMSETHNRRLRSTLNGSLAVPRSKTAIFDGSFTCTAPRLWNQLPEATKKASSLSCFKTQVKQFMFNQ